MMETLAQEEQGPSVFIQTKVETDDDAFRRVSNDDKTYLLIKTTLQHPKLAATRRFLPIFFSSFAVRI